MLEAVAVAVVLLAFMPVVYGLGHARGRFVGRIEGLSERAPIGRPR